MDETDVPKIVFCDHTEVLEQAFQKGLLSRDEQFTIVTAQEIISRKFNDEFEVLCLEPQRQVAWEIIENKYGEWTELAFSLSKGDAGTHLFLSEVVLQTFIALGKYVWASVAADISLSERTVVSLGGTTSAGKVLKSALCDYLRCEAIKHVDVGIVEEVPHQNNVTRRQLLKISRSNVVFYSFFKRFFQYWPNRLSGGTIWLARENDLMKETASSFVIGAGKKLVKLPMKPPKLEAESVNDFSPLLDQLVRSFRNVFGTVFGNSEENLIERDFQHLIFRAAQEYQFYRKWWDSYLNTADKLPDFVLTGFVASTYWVALAAECDQRGIKVVSTQHGHSRGLSKKHSGNRFGIMEEVRSDIFLTYDSASREHAVNNPYRKATVSAAGLPLSYRAKHKKVLDDAGIFDYMYISVGQRSVSGSHMLGFSSDRAFFEFEEQVIEEVFASEERTVLYKNYPSDGLSERYLGRDYARRKPNVYYYDGELLVHQLAGHAKALICMGPTSTLGWALATGRPIFYLVPYGGLEELPEFLSLLREAVFVLDLNHEEGSWQKFRETMYGDMSEILQVWDRKKPARDLFWTKYICVDGERGVKCTGKRLREMMRPDGLLYK